MKAGLSRRDLLCAGVGLFVVSGVSACGSNEAFTCAPAADLPSDDTRLRATLLYVDAAPNRTKSCATCAHFIPAPADGSCGSCKLMKGPIHPNGTCKVYSPKG